MCYIFEENETEFEENVKPLKDRIRDSSLVLGLSEENAKLVELSGGKGSSLSQLMILSKELVKNNYKNEFIVAKGIVVTTNAYKTLLKQSKDILKEISELEKIKSFIKRKSEE